jgi:superfamily I DNA and RNA helicase
MANVIRGDVSKPVSSAVLADYFENRSDIDGSLYLGHPIIGTTQGGYQIDALLVSKEHGIVIFNVIEGTNTNVDIEEIQDESFNKIQSKLLQQKFLTNKKKLMVEIGVVTFAPALHNKPNNIDDDYTIALNTQELDKYLSSQQWKSNEYFEQLNSTIQAITSIRKRKQRTYIQKENSRGAILQRMEESK